MVQHCCCHAVAAGFATLLFDLLSVSEAENRANVFDIPLLASRLQLAVEWMEVTGKLPRAFPVGFFGASTGGCVGLCAWLVRGVCLLVCG